MTVSNFNSLIEKVEKEFPELITPEILVDLGLGSHLVQCRIRKRGDLPFLKLSNSRILYLKQDVIAWLKNIYNSESSEGDPKCS